MLKIVFIFQNIETNSGIVLSADGKSLILQGSVLNGYVILKPQNSQKPYNEGLPSFLLMEFIFSDNNLAVWKSEITRLPLGEKRFSSISYLILESFATRKKYVIIMFY